MYFHFAFLYVILAEVFDSNTITFIRRKKMAQNPIVTITMENGDVIKAELYPEIAPNTVNNFISLIKKNFYDGLIFHRVIKGFMLQGGDPEGTGMGGPGYCIKGEFAAKAHRGCFINGKVHDAQLSRLTVLYHAQDISSP